MNLEDIRLEIFDGKIAPEDFIDDLEIFSSLKDNLKKDIVRNTLSWYPKRDIGEEWDKWMSEKSDEEKKQLTRAIRLLIFIVKNGIVKQFTKEFFSNELKKIGFDSNLIDFFLVELDRNREVLVEKIEKIKAPIIDSIDDLVWRIDVKKSSIYSKEINEPCVILKMSFSGEKNNEVVFELSYEELNSFIRTLSLIKEEIIKLGMKEEK